MTLAQKKPAPAMPAETKDTNLRGESEESEAARLERIGRERPVQFKTIWAEIAFAYSIVASEIMAVSSSLNLIYPANPPCSTNK